MKYGIDKGQEVINISTIKCCRDIWSIR